MYSFGNYIKYLLNFRKYSRFFPLQPMGIFPWHTKSHFSLVWGIPLPHPSLQTILTMEKIPTITDTLVGNLYILTYPTPLCSLTHLAKFTKCMGVPLTPNHIFQLLPSFHLPPTKVSSCIPYILSFMSPVHPYFPPYSS
jgi:hypothetical protein